MNWAQGFMVILTVWSPIWAYVIWNIEIKRVEAYIYSSIALFALTVYLAYNPIRLRAVTPWFHYYTFFLLLYILLIGYRYSFTQFNRVLSTGIFMVFLAGEFWELPVFLYDYLGKVGILENLWSGTRIDGPWIFSHIRRIYTVASGYLFLLLTEFKGNGRNLAILVSGIILSALTLLPLGIGKRAWFDMASTVARLLCLSMMGYAIYFGVEQK